jgi:hypothetical protein
MRIGIVKGCGPAPSRHSVRRSALILSVALLVGFLVTEAPALASMPPEQPRTEEAPPGSPRPPRGTAILYGTLNPHAPATTGYYFAYAPGSECTGGSRTQPGAEVEGEAVQVSSEVTGLEPNALYTYCIVARNAAGEETSGLPLSFTTPGEPPAVAQESAQIASPTAVTLAAQVNPDNEEASYSVQYATSASLEEAQAVPGGSLPAGFGGQSIGVSVEGLMPNTTYYYRVVAVSAAGGAAGPIESFTTPAMAPQAATGPVQSVGASTATFTGAVNPLNARTSYWFQPVKKATSGKTRKRHKKKHKKKHRPKRQHKAVLQ